MPPAAVIERSFNAGKNVNDLKNCQTFAPIPKLQLRIFDIFSHTRLLARLNPDNEKFTSSRTSFSMQKILDIFRLSTEILQNPH